MNSMMNFELDFERCWVPKGVTRVKYQRLNKKKKTLEKGKGKESSRGEERRERREEDIRVF